MADDTHDYEQDIEAVEYSDLPVRLAQRATDAMTFTKAFHDFMKDWRMITGDEVDTDKLESAFEAFVAEHQAACIFLASFQGVEEKLMSTYDSLRNRGDGVPSLVINGYKKLAERVKHTRDSFTAKPDDE
jgi:hypothetical protein